MQSMQTLVRRLLPFLAVFLVATLCGGVSALVKAGFASVWT